MFLRLFVGFFVVIVLAIILAVILLDDLYVKGVIKDELASTRGVNQIVINDLFQHHEVDARLTYWEERFNYYFTVHKIDEIVLPQKKYEQLLTSKVTAEVESGWAVDDVKLYYYDEDCGCVLTMEKKHGSVGTFQAYLGISLLIISLAIVAFVFYYVSKHKKQVSKLTAIYQAYGTGDFFVRADPDAPLPYKTLATTFNQMAEQIEALLQEQNTMVYGVSHDLRTPIARLRFGLDLTRSCHTVEAYQEQIQEMDLDLDELDQLVSEWLFYADLSSRNLSIRYQPVDLSAVIKRTLDKLMPLYPDIQLKMNLESELILGDPGLLARVVENLSINGLKFARSTVQVNLVVIGADICLQVEDDGSGIPEELHTKAMQPFVQLDNSRNSSGVGLGLAIVRTILDKHSIQFTIDKSKLGGAIFNIPFKKYKRSQPLNSK